MELRGLTISFAKNKAKTLRRNEMDLQKRLSDLDLAISSGVNSAQVENLKAEYNQLKQELSLIYENKGKGSIVRSKARWIEQGEKPTKYFLIWKKEITTIKQSRYCKVQMVVQ